MAIHDYVASSANGSIFPVFFIPYNKSLIDQAGSVKITGYWPCSCHLFLSLWTPTASGRCPPYSPDILTLRLIKIPKYIIDTLIPNSMETLLSAYFLNRFRSRYLGRPEPKPNMALV